MKLSDAKATMDLIARLWPDARWGDQLQAAFAQELLQLSIPGEEARAAIMKLRLRLKFPHVQPAELLEVLEQASEARSNRQCTITPEEIEVLGWLKNNPEESARLQYTWLSERGERCAHWQIGWLTDVRDASKWVWGKQFVAWVRLQINVSATT